MISFESEKSLDLSFNYISYYLCELRNQIIHLGYFLESTTNKLCFFLEC